MSHSYQHFVGIDIAAKTVTVSIMPRGGSPGPARTFDQTSDGWAALQQHLLQAGCQPSSTLVVLEATSSYWVALACVLHAAGLSVSLANPEKVHKYAQSQSRRSKTDALDAQLLAQFASERQLPLWTPPPQVYHDLRQRLVARDGLVAMRQQARNQLHALVQWPVVVAEVQTQLEGVIAQLDQEIRRLEKGLAKVLKDGAWAESAARMLSISGIGVVTTGWILVSTMNWTTCETGGAAANYAGLTPLRKESGTSVRQKPQVRGGGNARLRHAMYMAAVSAVQHNAAMKAFYQRLKAAGKPSKVGLVAVGRKLLTVAHAVVRKNEDYSASYQARVVGS